MSLSHLKPGDRVRIQPWSDFFMMGETHGTVDVVGRKYVTVRGFRSNRPYKFAISGDSIEKE